MLMIKPEKENEGSRRTKEGCGATGVTREAGDGNGGDPNLEIARGVRTRWQEDCSKRS